MLIVASCASSTAEMTAVRYVVSSSGLESPTGKPQKW
jgi:hypothetical protein